MAYKKSAPLLLSFEEALAQKLARVCRKNETPSWPSGGFQMTAVRTVCRALRLNSLRDYIQIAEEIKSRGEEYGFYTENHRAHCMPSLDRPAHAEWVDLDTLGRVRPSF